MSSNGYISKLLRGGEFGDTTTTRKHRPDYMIVLYMGLLMLLGLVVMYAIGPQRANVLNSIYGTDYGSMYFFGKQFFSLLLAVSAFFVIAFIPYTSLTKNAGVLLSIGIGLCIVLAIASWLHLGIAQQSLGATRWFNMGPLGSLQPAEVLKFSILVFAAGFLGTKAMKGKLNSIKDSIIPIGLVVGVAVLFIVIIQKDLGTGISLVSIVMAMLLVAGINVKNGLLILTSILVLGVGLIASAPHRVERWLTFVGSDNSGQSDSYHIDQAKLAIGTGGLFGVGVGNSVQSTGYLPEAINDSVFAIMGETFGFVGLITILAIFTALLMRLVRLMDHLVDIRLKLIAAGVFGWLGAHVILNVASMIGVMPLTGITLPFLSLGGTSMLFIAAALGLAFQLSYYTVNQLNSKEGYNENISSRRGVGRSRYASRRGSSRN